jgi:phospholipase C
MIASKVILTVYLTENFRTGCKGIQALCADILHASVTPILFSGRRTGGQYQFTVTGNLAKIDHITIMMQENRSFDQVFGYLSREGYPGLGVCERHGRQAWARRPNPNAGLSAFPRRFRASSSMRRRE